MWGRGRITIGLAAGLALGFAPGAHAYIDGGTASMLFQLLIAGVMGALFSAKLFWARLRAFFGAFLGKDLGH